MQNLTQDEWREAMALLDQVLDLDPPQQQEALQASDAQEKIRTAVARMLAQEADEDDVLDRGAFDLIAPVVEDDDRFDDTAVRALETLSSGGTGLRARPGDLEKGMVIGAYRIEGLLGRGGMGEVYLAERADDAYTQKVALKLVRVQGLGSGEVEARFRRERQILAGLRHEHIARLLDGGVTERGRPFLVMEYVDGQTITTYADENGLDVDQRLELFEQACRAVQYAHRRAIIHRDLKPTNLIVEERRAGGDGQSGTVRPVAKLLDFGIAKLLEAETTEEALTRADERLMTPEYAAPEQISGDPVTTATDVYQLGALMYELLTGQRPFYEVTEGKSGRSRIRAAEDAILQTEPENPSQVLTRNAETLQRTHGTDFQHLIGRVRGDLDAIVRKALRKDPAGRYDSVSDLLDDLRRYRDGRPVEARRGTWTYRTKKFIRRNRTPVVLGTAVAVLIAAFVVSLIVQTNRLETALADVRAESERREEVQDLFTSILDVAEPSPEYRDTLTVRDMLNRSAEQAYMQFADHPRLKAWTYTRLTSYEYNLGEYERAVAFGDSALAVYDSLHQHAVDDRFAITNEYASALGNTAAALRELDRIDEALTLRERAVSVITGRQRSRGQARLAGTWFQSSMSEKEQLIAEIQARMNYLSVVEMVDRTRAHAEVDTINTLIRRFKDAGGSAQNETLLFEYGTLAGYYLDEGAFDVADSLFTKTLSFREEKYGHISQEVETILNNRIAMYVRMADYRKAYAVASEALSIGRQIYGNDHPTLRPTLNHVGNALVNLDRHEEAVSYFREALRISRVEFGADHDNTLDARLRLANAYNSMGNPGRAVPILQDVLRVYNAKYGSKADLTIGVRVNLAAALRQVGATDDALRQHRLVLDIARRLYPENPTAEEVKTIEYRQIARPYIAILRSYSLLLDDLGRRREKCQIMAEYDQVYRDSEIGPQMYGQDEGAEIRQFLEGCDRSQLS
jgi:serine/threonine-protein kinase